jgi:glycosyltransferase involved in cell wall biosynthesis
VDAFLAAEGLAPRAAAPCLELSTQQLGTHALARLYRAADAFVLPTRGEGWGRPLLEAMVMGVPVIATNWSGHTEFMRPYAPQGLVPVTAFVAPRDAALYDSALRWAEVRR